ncbi:zinc-dependent metalloprotease family protein [Rhizocola hellebori]|uniref:zinc-dependent metalloprotease family protein n=1 Tax=Rhizocola hellebori TaxID=1392758 RepID=UPI001945883D|nr:zinc-dependent metalloprotease family protein [Rhizocola hellebori]
MSLRLTRSRAAVIAAAFLAITAFGPVAPANADNYSGQTGDTGCTGLNEADNATHSFHYVDLTQHMTDATNWARTNNLNPTDINTTYDSTLDSLTDVVVRDVHYVDYCGYDWLQPGGSGVVGLATCDSLSPSGQCEQHTVRYNLNFTESTPQSNERGLACHELGHTLGLQHTTGNTCMQTGYPKPVNDYSNHDRTHIANNY